MAKQTVSITTLPTVQNKLITTFLVRQLTHQQEQICLNAVFSMPNLDNIFRKILWLIALNLMRGPRKLAWSHSSILLLMVGQLSGMPRQFHVETMPETRLKLIQKISFQCAWGCMATSHLSTLPKKGIFVAEQEFLLQFSEFKEAFFKEAENACFCKEASTPKPSQSWSSC